MKYCNVVVFAVHHEYILLHSPSLGASRAVRVLPRGSDKFEPKLHLLLPVPSTLPPPCALPFSPLCLLARLQSAHWPGYPSKWYCEMQSTLFSVRVFDWELSAVRVRVGLAAPSQRRDGGVVESSRNWPDRYCRPAKIITCWNGNPVSLQGRDGPRNGCKRSPSRDLDQILRNISTFQDEFGSSMVFDR